MQSKHNYKLVHYDVLVTIYPILATYTNFLSTKITFIRMIILAHPILTLCTKYSFVQQYYLIILPDERNSRYFTAKDTIIILR